MNLSITRSGPFFPEALGFDTTPKQRDPKEEIHLFQATERLYHSGHFTEYTWQELCLLIAVTKSAEFILSVGPQHEVAQYRSYAPLKTATTDGSTPISRLNSFLGMIKAARRVKGGSV